MCNTAILPPAPACRVAKALLEAGVLEPELHLAILLGEPPRRPLPRDENGEVDLARLFAEIAGESETQDDSHLAVVSILCSPALCVRHGYIDQLAKAGVRSATICG